MTRPAARADPPPDGPAQQPGPLGEQGIPESLLAAPVGRSGIAFLGDRDKFVGTGKQRIASLADRPGRLAVDALLAEAEKAVTFHGYAPAAPRVSVKGGRAGTVQFDSGSGHFSVDISADLSVPARQIGGDPIRPIQVSLEKGE